MKSQTAITPIHRPRGPSVLRTGQYDRKWRGRLSKVIDRLVLGLAVAGPPDGAALDLDYAEAMVEVYDDWFALRGRGSRDGVLP
jgi:hypothetical protein